MKRSISKLGKLISSAISADGNELILVIESPRAIYSIFRTFLGFRVYELEDSQWVYFGLFADEKIRFRPLKNLNYAEALDRILWRNPRWVIAGDKIVSQTGV